MVDEMFGDVAGRPPSDEWLMDGTRHGRGGQKAGAACHCGRHDWMNTCKACGGLVHTQGVYGGMFKLCEDCGSRP